MTLADLEEEWNRRKRGRRRERLVLAAFVLILAASAWGAWEAFGPDKTEAAEPAATEEAPSAPN